MRTRRALSIGAMFGILMMAVAGPVAAEDPTTEPPATQLRVAIDRVLAEHAFLIIQVMRTGLTSGPEFTAAGDALDEDTNELVAAIESVYGPDAAAAVGEQWRNHIAYIVDYARALDAGDTSAAQLADSQLQQYVTDFSALLAGAAHLPEEAVQGLISEHIEQLEQIASFETAKFGEAYPAIRATYDHMFMIGDGLAAAISDEFPDRFSGSLYASSPATNLRLQLNRLLGEDAELAGLAMRAGLTGAPDAAAATAALEDNTLAVQSAIAIIYDDAAGAAFAAKWRERTSLFLDYVAATKAGDEVAQQASLDGLHSYNASFTDFVAAANPQVSATELEVLISDQTNLLIDQTNRFAEGDFADAYSIGRQAFAHSGVLGDYLARAIADQFPLAFPNVAMSSPDSGWGTKGGVLLLIFALLVLFWTRLRMLSTRTA
jgi:hypothetical protein